MTEWERQVTKHLMDSEYHFLAEYDKWLHSAFAHIPIGGDEHVIHAFNVSPHQRLSSILFRHSSDSLASGQAHGQSDAEAVRHTHTKRLADLPSIDIHQAAQGDDFLPVDAIKVLQARAIQLAGDVESDITSAIKEILLKHLVGVSTPETHKEIAAILDQNMKRASLIVTTETTYAYNRGRLLSYRDNQVDYVMFRAVMDGRTCGICSSRNGLIAPIGDIGGDVPPVHGRCRCVLSPIYSSLQPELLTPKALDWSNVAPLPKGWAA